MFEAEKKKANGGCFLFVFFSPILLFFHTGKSDNGFFYFSFPFVCKNRIYGFALANRRFWLIGCWIILEFVKAHFFSMNNTHFVNSILTILPDSCNNEAYPVSSMLKTKQRLAPSQSNTWRCIGSWITFWFTYFG